LLKHKYHLSSHLFVKPTFPSKNSLLTIMQSSVKSSILRDTPVVRFVLHQRSSPSC
jgi:hypothetical protein